MLLQAVLTVIRFPGPRLAAMSSVYAMYHDIPHGSSYIKKFPQWHDIYGPIIRIEPNHLHIRDIDAYSQIFCIGTKYNKDPKVYNLAFSEGSFANNLVTRQVKGHRDLYSPHFSRINAQAGEFVVKQYLNKFIHKLSVMNDPIDLTLGYRALCADIVARYVLGKPFGALDGDDFSNPMLDFMQDSLGSPSFTFGWYLPSINKQMHKLARRFPVFFVLISKPIRAMFYQMNVSSSSSIARSDVPSSAIAESPSCEKRIRQPLCLNRACSRLLCTLTKRRVIPSLTIPLLAEMAGSSSLQVSVVSRERLY